MNTEILIIGSGMVGMSLAHQLKKKSIAEEITIIEKETDIGKHSSGRNSGVIHAGIYYKPNSIKANVCIEGSKMLKAYIKDNELKINNCGKIISPQDIELDSQLDILYDRGKKNGAEISFINEKELNEKISCARTASGRALWSPNTSVVNPKEILFNLEQDLKNKGVKILKNEKIIKIEKNDRKIYLRKKREISYKYLFNCAGAYSLKIAESFGIAKDYLLIPFKGIYWDIKDKNSFQIKTNLYPVPDINVPFLGVHFTPTLGSDNTVTIGPTANLAFGLENYKGTNSIEYLKTLRNISILSRQFFMNKNGFRKYVYDQVPLVFEPFMLKSARKLIPNLKREHVTISNKVGIRAQLYDKKNKNLVDDFLCINDKFSTHILNAISPAFTASFALANLIIRKSNL